MPQLKHQQRKTKHQLKHQLQKPMKQQKVDFTLKQNYQKNLKQRTCIRYDNVYHIFLSAPSGPRSIRDQVLDMVQEGIDWNGSVLGLYNTCWWSTYSQYFSLNCGDDAESYYEEFDYDQGMLKYPS